MHDNNSAIHHSSFIIPHFRSHAASAIGPICRYVCTGSHAGEYSPRREYHIATTQHVVPGVMSLLNWTSNIFFPVWPSSFQFGSPAAGGRGPAKLMIVAPDALRGRRLVSGKARSSI